MVYMDNLEEDLKIIIKLLAMSSTNFSGGNTCPEIELRKLNKE